MGVMRTSSRAQDRSVPALGLGLLVVLTGCSATKPADEVATRASALHLPLAVGPENVVENLRTLGNASRSEVALSSDGSSTLLAYTETQSSQLPTELRYGLIDANGEPMGVTQVAAHGAGARSLHAVWTGSSYVLVAKVEDGVRYWRIGSDGTLQASALIQPYLEPCSVAAASGIVYVQGWVVHFQPGAGIARYESRLVRIDEAGAFSDLGLPHAQVDDPASLAGTLVPLSNRILFITQDASSGSLDIVAESIGPNGAASEPTVLAGGAWDQRQPSAAVRGDELLVLWHDARVGTGGGTRTQRFDLSLAPIETETRAGGSLPAQLAAHRTGYVAIVPDTPLSTQRYAADGSLIDEAPVPVPRGALPIAAGRTPSAARVGETLRFTWIENSAGRDTTFYSQFAADATSPTELRKAGVPALLYNHQRDLQLAALPGDHHVLLWTDSGDEPWNTGGRNRRGRVIDGVNPTGSVLELPGPNLTNGSYPLYAVRSADATTFWVEYQNTRRSYDLSGAALGSLLTTPWQAFNTLPDEAVCEAAGGTLWTRCETALGQLNTQTQQRAAIYSSKLGALPVLEGMCGTRCVCNAAQCLFVDGSGKIARVDASSHAPLDTSFHQLLPSVAAVAGHADGFLALYRAGNMLKATRIDADAQLLDQPAMDVARAPDLAGAALAYDGTAHVLVLSDAKKLWAVRFDTLQPLTSHLMQIGEGYEPLLSWRNGSGLLAYLRFDPVTRNQHAVVRSVTLPMATPDAGADADAGPVSEAGVEPGQHEDAEVTGDATMPHDARIPRESSAVTSMQDAEAAALEAGWDSVTQGVGEDGNDARVAMADADGDIDERANRSASADCSVRVWRTGGTTWPTLWGLLALAACWRRKRAGAARR